MLNLCTDDLLVLPELAASTSSFQMILNQTTNHTIIEVERIRPILALAILWLFPTWLDR